MKIKIILAALVLLTGSLKATEPVDPQTYAHQLSSWIIDEVAAGRKPDLERIYLNAFNDVRAMGLGTDGALNYVKSVAVTVTSDLEIAGKAANKTADIANSVR